MRRVAWDPNVAAVELRIEDAKLGLGRIEELHGLIAELRARKKVVAYLEQASLANYYLASACDGIVMDPAGSLFLGGLAHQVTYFKGALDKVGVKVEVERIAEYKGAMEPFLFDGGSQPVKENHASMLDDNFSRIVAALGERRKLSETTVRTLIDQAVFFPLGGESRWPCGRRFGGGRARGGATLVWAPGSGIQGGHDAAFRPDPGFPGMSR